MKNLNDTPFLSEFKNKKFNKCLIQGIGNPLREDDGAGYVFIEKIKNLNLNADLDWVFQLQIENAEQWSKYDLIIVIDAHIDQHDKLNCKVLNFESQKPEDLRQLYSHSLSAEVILNLCHSYFKKKPTLILMTLKGKNFGLGESLSDVARESLNFASEELIMFLNLIKRNDVS